jgi:hypothetical protein
MKQIERKVDIVSHPIKCQVQPPCLACLLIPWVFCSTSRCPCSHANTALDGYGCSHCPVPTPSALYSLPLFAIALPRRLVAVTHALLCMDGIDLHLLLLYSHPTPSRPTAHDCLTTTTDSSTAIAHLDPLPLARVNSSSCSHLLLLRTRSATA